MRNSPRDLILAPDWLIDGDGSLLPAGSAVRLKGTKIEAVGSLSALDPDSADVQQLKGQSLMPGLIDCHGYLSVDPNRPDPMGGMHGEDLVERAWITARHLAINLASGVTTMRVMGEGHGLDYQARQAVNIGLLQGPSLVCSGAPVCPSHSHQAARSGGADGVDGVRKAVRKRVAEGADWLKLVVTGGVNAPGERATTCLYDDEEVSVALREAKTAGLPVAVAAHGGVAIAMCARLGARTFEHCAFFDEDAIETAASHDATLVFTLARFFRPDGIELSGRDVPGVRARLDRAREHLRAAVPKALSCGVSVVLGTDNMHGLLADDARLFVELGATPKTAIAALTGKAARALGLEHITGNLRPSLQADLVAFSGNPLTNIVTLSRPTAVYFAGTLAKINILIP